MKILIIVAMTSELEGFLKVKDFEIKLISGVKVYYYKENDKEIYLAKTEVGKVNASSLTTFLLLKLKPKYVINAGIAGALNPSLKLFDVIVSSKVCYHDFDLTAFNLPLGQLDNHDLYFKISKKLIDATSSNTIKGLIVSGDQFISSKENLEKINRNFKKALCCDMEGAAIVHTCENFKRKAIVIRAISDNAFLTNQVTQYEDNKFKAIDVVVKETMFLIDNL